MQFKLFALSAALAASVSAQTCLNQISVYAVLATALPASLVQEALTNSKAVSSEIASEFKAGTTPTWFTALPTPIQSYLINGQNASCANATAAGNSTSHSKTGTMHKTTAKTTHITGVGHGTKTVPPVASSSKSASASASSGSSSSSGAASLPTQVVGAGLAGVVGLVGLLAL